MEEMLQYKQQQQGESKYHRHHFKCYELLYLQSHLRMLCFRVVSQLINEGLLKENVFLFILLPGEGLEIRSSIEYIILYYTTKTQYFLASHGACLDD